MPRRRRRRRRRVRRRRRSRTPRGRRRSCATIGSDSESRSPCSRNSRACAFDSRARSPRRCNAPGRPSRRNSPRRWARRRCYWRTTEAPPPKAIARAKRSAPAGTARGTGMGGGRPGDWQCPRGCGTVFANKSNCFRCGAPKGGGGGGGGGGGRRGFGGGGRAAEAPGADGERSAAEVRPHRACSRAEGADAEGDVAEVAAEVAAGGDELEGILQGGFRDTRRGVLAAGGPRATRVGGGERYEIFAALPYSLPSNVHRGTAVYVIVRSTDRSSPTLFVSLFHFPVMVCTDHPCRFRNDFLAAIIAAVGVGSKNTGRTSCGYA